MSKIAKQIINIPDKVDIYLNKKEKIEFYALGPLGKSEIIIIPNDVELILEGRKIKTKSKTICTALAGTYNSLIKNIIIGVLEGYQQKLEIKGANYKFELKNEQLEISSGKSHVDFLKIPHNLQVIFENNKNIIIKGIDKQKVKLFAAQIRDLRKPGVYQAKGIYYAEEKIILKSIKASKKK